MPWTRSGGWTDPWLPLADTSRNVEDQRGDPSSTLNFSKALIALRRDREELCSGTYEEVPAPTGVWAWRRGAGVLVALNLGSGVAEIDAEGTVALGTARGRDGERVRGRLRLDPAEGAVVLLG
jgi:glycosidase